METDLSSLTLAPWEIILRLVCAMLIGAVIGAEREYTHRPAGMRTHMLVALGSCAVMVASQLIFCQYRAVGAEQTQVEPDGFQGMEINMHGKLV